MSIKLTSNFFITSSLDWYGGFYQQLAVYGSNFQELGDKFVKIAEQAQAFRRYDKVRGAAQILANIPIKQYQAIGLYYIGLCEYRHGQISKDVFERVAEEAPDEYRVRAMQTLSLIEGRKQDCASELYWLVESLKVSPSVESFRGIAIVKAKEGYHQSAVKDLESLYPLVKHAEPINYFHYLNSLAVELGEVGRKYEARNICHHVLASPFAIAYPEWRETAEELKGPNRSFAAIDSPTPARMGNLLTMPVVEQAEPVKQDRPAPVINLESWKARMGKKKNGDKGLEGLDSRELLLRLMELGTAAGMTDDKLYKVVAMMEKLLSEPDEPQNPDDDKTGA